MDTGDHRDEESKGPEVDGTPFKLVSGENMLNKCLCVKIRVYLSSKSFLRNITKYCAFCGFL